VMPKEGIFVRVLRGGPLKVVDSITDVQPGVTRARRP